MILVGLAQINVLDWLQVTWLVLLIPVLLQRAERAAFANNIKTQATCCKGLCPCSNRYRSSDLGEPDLVIYCDEPKVRTSSKGWICLALTY